MWGAPTSATIATRTRSGFACIARPGDRQLRNQLIEHHRWLAVHCARRFSDKGEPLDDLVQVAMLGVLKAVERFDPDYGATFATFAVPTIVGELRRHFRDTTWAVHVPRRAKDLQHTVKATVDELGHVLGRSPTVARDRRPRRDPRGRGDRCPRGRPLLPQRPSRGAVRRRQRRRPSTSAPSAKKSGV